MNEGRSIRVELDAVWIDDRRFDPVALDFIARMSEEFGPELMTFEIEGWNPPRKVHVLSGGVLILEVAGRAANVFFCFHRTDANPYPSNLSDVPVFSGSLTVGGLTFAGGESEDFVRRIPSLEGHASIRGFRNGPVYVGLQLEKERNKLGRRAGPRRLVLVTIEWNERGRH